MPKPAPRNRRRDLLTAFAHLVNEHGVRAATLDAVADAAQVSKGGLLYHFRDRDALVAGLCDHFSELVEEDIAEQLDSGMSAPDWYLSTSADYDSPLETTMAALIQLVPAYEATIRPVLIAARERWFQLVADEIGDRDLATAVLLLGDGIAYNAELEGKSAPKPLVSEATRKFLSELISRAN